jgi:uncharacterized protein YbcV (DUF1398 family)
MPNLENRELPLNKFISEIKKNNTNAENVKSRDEKIEEIVTRYEAISAENAKKVEEISKNNIELRELLFDLLDIAMENPKNQIVLDRLKKN